MKKLFSSLFVLSAVAVHAADPVTQKLQQGLFEEEANHDLKAAVQAYEAVVQHGDEQRKILATAIFRLGECHRKLGNTNEAQTYYSRILRDFSDQRQLVELSRKYGATQAPASDSEVVRELERRHARLLGELVEANARTERIKTMSLDELTRVSRQLFDDPELQSLQNNLNTAQQEAAALNGRGIGAGHADMRAVTARMKLIQSQVTDRLKSLVENEVGAAQLLNNQVNALEQELARAKAQGLARTPAMTSNAVALLKEEVALAEQQVNSAERIYAAGQATSQDVLEAKKEVLRLKRLLPENSGAVPQEQLLRQQKDIVQELLKELEKRVQVGQLPNKSPQEFSIRRELLSLERDLDAIRSVPADSAAGTPGSQMTTAEAEALARVRSLALNSPDLLQSPGKDGLSELQRAAMEGHYTVVDFILSQNVNPNGLESGESPPLLMAAQRGHLRIVELLLDKGAKVNASFSGSTSPPSYINGTTALMMAAENGFRSVVDLLLARGADVRQRSGIGSTALHHAALKGHVQIMETLLSRSNAVDELAQPPYILQGWPSWTVNGATPLHLVADRGAKPAAELLLQHGASARATNYALQTPLLVGILHSDICALLLKNGADPNAESREGHTPLGSAIVGARAKTVELLLTNGANVNAAVTIKGDPGSPQYPVHLAVAYGEEMLNTVLAAKPALEVVNKNGVTPLFQAINTKPAGMVEALLKAGADANHAIFGVPPISKAADQLNVQMIRALLKHGANPNVLGQTGTTPLEVVQKAISSLRGETPRIGGNVHPNAPSLLSQAAEIERMLKHHGASEYLPRLIAIDYRRPGWAAVDSPKVFFRGTNDYNHYTLFEFLAQVFADVRIPFPDLAHVTIERIDGTNATPRNVTVDVEALLNSGDCAKDISLQWGDRIFIPEVDHPLNEKWGGLSIEQKNFLARCLRREVQIIVKNETNIVSLESSINSDKTRPAPISRVGAIGNSTPRKIIESYRLKEVVYRANVLRASSDPTRVIVIRKRSSPKEEKRWEIDLTKVQASNEAGTPGMLWSGHDLWLRDGDVIEIPER